MATQAIDAEVEESTVEQAEVTSVRELRSRFKAAREAQERWKLVGLKDRLRLIRGTRQSIAENADELVASVECPHRTTASETLAGEIIPLADACRFLEIEAPSILRLRRLSRRRRPFWLSGVSTELRREPFGIVLIIGASNYPLFLTGVQTLQALVAGNGVFIKPGAGATKATQVLVNSFIAGGFDQALVQVLPEEPVWVRAAVEAGVNKVVLTGSADTGCRVQTLLAKSLIPATMELSGCDAVFVLKSADLTRVARCLAFGMRFNGSATCIAPRRVFVSNEISAELESRLGEILSSECGELPSSFSEHTVSLINDAVSDGARIVQGGVVNREGCTTLARATVLAEARADMELLRSDVFAPVLSIVPVASTREALQANRTCPYALGAAVFGEDKEAHELAQQIDAGCVVINDIIAPTADPRVPFGGRKQSGFGVTRGAAGLEEMTQLKAIIHQRSGWLPHLDEPTPLDAKLLSEFLGTVHGRGWRRRLYSAWNAARAAIEQRNWQRKRRKMTPQP